MRILDLFAGLGGVARGFQSYLKEHGMEFEYVAVEVDRKVARAHAMLNPSSTVIVGDAYSLSDDFIRSFDFVWASPPCQTHSKALLFYRSREQFREPDMRLYELIARLHELRKPYIVENVDPYYDPPIIPRSRVCRHVLWSNLPLLREIPCPLDTNFYDVKDDSWRLAEWHELDYITYRRLLRLFRTVRDLRPHLRNMVHWRIAYTIASIVFPLLEEPQLQTTLEVIE